MASNEDPSQGGSSFIDTSDTPNPLNPSDTPQEQVSRNDTDMTPKTAAQAPAPAADTPYEPVLIGIYGLGGSGVEHLKRQLEAALGHAEYEYFDLLQDVLGPEQLSGRSAPSQGDDELAELRSRLIAAVREQCRKSGKIGIVLGHRMLFPDDLKIPGGPIVKGHFWPLDAGFARAFYYAAAPASVVQFVFAKLSHVKFHRKKLTQKMIKGWDDSEYDAVKIFCNNHRVPIEFLRSEQGDVPSDAVVKELVDRIIINSQSNQQRVVSKVLEAMEFETAPSNVVVLIEGHNVLARDVASTTTWSKLMSTLGSWGASGAAAIQRDTYRILRLMAHRHTTERDEEQIKIATKEMTMDAELERLLWKLKMMRIPTVILTCGHKSVWEHVLRQPSRPEGMKSQRKKLEQIPELDDHFKVIGGGRISDQIVVAPEDKAAVVRALQDKHGRRVCVIGGSELDVPMLKAAGQDAFIRSPSVGELDPGVKVLLREHGGQATCIGLREDALHSDWQGRGNDIFDAMGLHVDGVDGGGIGDGISEEPRTDLEEIMNQAQTVLGLS